MKLLKIIIVAISAFLTSCTMNLPETHWRGTTLVFGPDNRPKVDDTVVVDQLWRQNIGNAFDSDAEGFQISREGSTLYVASQSGLLTALDTESGDIIWSTKSDQTLSAGVSYGKNNIYVANDNGEVFAFDKRSSKKVWQKQLSSEVLIAPVEVGNTVVVRSQDGKVVGLAVNDAELRWEIKRDLPSLSLRREIPPLVLGNVVILGLPTGSLLAIDASNGRTLWDIPVSIPSGINEIERMRDIAGQPIINQNVIYSNSFQGEVVSIDATERRFRWKNEISSFHPMSEDENYLFISASSSSVVALQKSTGEIGWQSDELSRLSISSPTVVGEYLLVFGSDNEAYVLTKNDGSLVGKFNFPGDQVIGKPIVLDSLNIEKPIFYALSSNGQLYSYAISKIDN